MRKMRSDNHYWFETRLEESQHFESEELAIETYLSGQLLMTKKGTCSGCKGEVRKW